MNADHDQTQQLQMQAMSNADIEAGTTETQQMRITAPVGVGTLSPLSKLFDTCVCVSVKYELMDFSGSDTSENEDIIQ